MGVCPCGEAPCMTCTFVLSAESVNVRHIHLVLNVDTSTGPQIFTPS